MRVEQDTKRPFPAEPGGAAPSPGVWGPSERKEQSRAAPRGAESRRSPPDEFCHVEARPRAAAGNKRDVKSNEARQGRRRSR